MSFHYIREPGEQGNILTGNTAARGIDLATLLNHTRLPLKVALELTASVADILTIASQDSMVHGDLKPGAVRLSSAGTVAVEGFGDSRRTTRAPEGTPRGQPTDIYGLGIVLYSLLSPDPLGRLPRTRDQHDAAILARVRRADFQSLTGKSWLPDVQSFIASILAFDPAERPAALDIANLMSHLAARCEGEGLQVWSANTIDETGFAPIEQDNFEDRLASAKTVTGPMVLAERPRVAPAAQGQHTASWSREKLVEKFGGEELAPPRARTQPLERATPIHPQSLRAAPTLQGLGADFERAQRTTEQFTVPEPAPTMIPEMFDDAPEPTTRQLGPSAAPPPADVPPPFPPMETMSEPPAAPPVPPVAPAQRSDMPPTMPPAEPPPLPVAPRSAMPPTMAPPETPPGPPTLSKLPPPASVDAPPVPAALDDAPPAKQKGGTMKYVIGGGVALIVGCGGCAGLAGLGYLLRGGL